MRRTVFPGLVILSLILIGCGTRSADKPSDGSDNGEFKLVLDGPSKAPDIKPLDDKGLDRKAPEDKQQTVQFLNSQGTGRRFCIIADCSNSLSVASFGLIKRELIKTLQTLDADTQFHVMFFSGKPFPMPDGDWLFGKKDIDRVQPWIEAQKQSSGTKAGPPFRRALALKPRPDVIFFMTDGKLTPGDPELVASLNVEKPPVVIHTILFTTTADIVPPGVGARESLEKIAKDGGGTFKQFIDPDVLPKKKKKKGM